MRRRVSVESELFEVANKCPWDTCPTGSYRTWPFSQSPSIESVPAKILVGHPRYRDQATRWAWMEDTLEATGQASCPPSSTTAPTDECHEIEALSSCFETGQAIELTLFQCNRRGDEIMALFRVKDVDRHSLRNPLNGNQCARKVAALVSLQKDPCPLMIRPRSYWMERPGPFPMKNTS
jgi:hypothetical protein